MMDGRYRYVVPESVPKFASGGQNMRKSLIVFIQVLMVISIYAGPALAGTEGPYNTFYGAGAGFSNTQADAGNTFIGVNAGNLNQTGTDNVFLGRFAGYKNNSWSNVFIGFEAGYENASGHANTYTGTSCGSNTSSASYNSFFGYGAGLKNETGGFNTYVGYYAGWGNISGQYNVFIGGRAGNTETGSNLLYIDNCSTGGDCDQPLIFGNFSSGQLGGRFVRIDGKLIFPSDERLKKNIAPLKSSLDKVMKLNGISYEWKAAEKQMEGREIGLLAQDVEKVLPELVLMDSKGYKSLAYDKLIPVLVEAMKEQQSVIKHQAAEIKELKEKISRMDRLEAKINRLETRDISAQK
jgi:hypothetical protein